MSKEFFVGTDSNSSFIVQSANAIEPSLVINSLGVPSFPNRPAFSACLTETLLQQTGAGRIANYLANQCLTNIGNYFNLTSGEFTAPVTGIYHFDCEILVKEITDIMNYGVMLLKVGSLTLHRGLNNPSAIRNSLNQATFQTSWTGPMQAGEVAQVAIKISGGLENSVSIHGSEGCSYSSGFSGFLVS